MAFDWKSYRAATASYRDKFGGVPNGIARMASINETADRHKDVMQMLEQALERGIPISDTEWKGLAKRWEETSRQIPSA